MWCPLRMVGLVRAPGLANLPVCTSRCVRMMQGVVVTVRIWTGSSDFFIGILLVKFSPFPATERCFIWSRASRIAFHLSMRWLGRVTLVDMTCWLLIAVVSTPLKATAGLAAVMSFLSPGTFWAIGCTLCASVATYLRAAMAAYVCDRSTRVKPSWVISLAWEP